jgi:hypothetical protein
MPLEVEKKLGRKLEFASIDAYDTVSLADIKEGLIPPSAMKLLNAYLSDPKQRDIEVLSAVQKDGIQDFLLCEDIKTKQSCRGILLDTFGDSVLGETSFFGSYAEGSNVPVQVSTTMTHGVEGVGLGTKRLLTINEYCKKRFGVGICSSSDPVSGAQRIWDDLVRNKLAERIRLPDGTKRYRLI